MAIDTAAKRRAAAGVSVPLLPIPGGGVPAADRALLLRHYLSAAFAVVVEFWVTADVGLFNEPFTGDSWHHIHIDDYGFYGKLRVVRDGAGMDISNYSTLRYVLRSPNGYPKVRSAAFDTNGVDGVLKYLFASGDIDEIGEWSVQARLAKTGAELTSESMRFDVRQRMDW